MHCYNCGKEIDKHKDDVISLDDLNWSHSECLYNPPHLPEDTELPLNVLSKCHEARANYASALRAYIESMMKSGMDACEIWCELEITLNQVEEIVSDLED